MLDRTTYWRRYIQRIGLLLLVWFVAGYICSIFLIEPLNDVVIGGVPLGFWMAQQGSIFVFVLLILIFAVSIGRLDREAGVEEAAGTTTQAGEGH